MAMPSPAAQSLPTDRTFERELLQIIPHLRAFARSLCGDPTFADDLAQEAVAKAWASRASYTMGTNMKAWVFLILRNHYYSETRRAWRSIGLDPDVAANTLMASDDPSSSLELDDLRRALAMLPAEQREAVILVGAAGLSHEEVSGIMGVAIGTVKSRVSRGRDRLALILAEGALDADGQAPHAAMADLFAQIDTLRAGAR